MSPNYPYEMNRLNFSLLRRLKTQVSIGPKNFTVVRYDFVLHANQKSDVYWMRFGGLLDCTNNRVHAAAVLVYDNVVDDAMAAMIDIGENGVNNYETFVNVPGEATYSALQGGLHCTEVAYLLPTQQPWV